MTTRKARSTGGASVFLLTLFVSACTAVSPVADQDSNEPVFLENDLESSQPVRSDYSISVQWYEAMGGRAGDVGNHACLTDDGGVVVVGWTESFGSGDRDVLLTKVDRSGGMIWRKTVGGPGTEVGHGVLALSAGGFLVVGEASRHGEASDVFLVRTDSEGNLLWEQQVGGEGDEVGAAVVQGAGETFLVAGWTTSSGAGPQSIYVLKINEWGDVLWERSFGGFGWDEATWLDVIGHDEFVVGGSTEGSFSEAKAIYLLHIDGSGKLISEKVVEQNSQEDGGIEAYSGAVVKDGIIICAQTGIVDPEIVLVKTAFGEDVEWRRRFPGPGGVGYSVTAVPDGGYVISGYLPTAESFDALMIRTDTLGNELWRRTLGGGGYETARCAVVVGDSAYILVGSTDSFGHGEYDVLLIALEEARQSQPGEKESKYDTRMELKGTRALGMLAEVPGAKCLGVVEAVNIDKGAVVLGIRSGETKIGEIWHILQDGRSVATLEIRRVSNDIVGGKIIKTEARATINVGDTGVVYAQD